MVVRRQRREPAIFGVHIFGIKRGVTVARELGWRAGDQLFVVRLTGSVQRQSAACPDELNGVFRYSADYRCTWSVRLILGSSTSW
jgi:hypothetical protein